MVEDYIKIVDHVKCVIKIRGGRQVVRSECVMSRNFTLNFGIL